MLRVGRGSSAFCLIGFRPSAFCNSTSRPNGYSLAMRLATPVLRSPLVLFIVQSFILTAGSSLVTTLPAIDDD